MLTQKRLKEVLHYDKDTGVFIWKVNKSRTARIGFEAGSFGVNGYRRIVVDRKGYFAHRLAFLYIEGYFPEYDTDHRNGKRDDNRWKNLRHVTRSCNLQNTKIRKDNTSGFPGVYWDKRDEKWQAQIAVGGKSSSSLGRYEEKIDAALARITAEVHCESWQCDCRGKLAMEIKKAWPKFNFRSLL